MGPSIQIAKFIGIPIKLHWTFILMFPLGFYLMERPGFGMQGMIYFTVLLVLISICVILHECGHALAAKYFGIQTDDIILSPLFGVARIQKLPEKPIGEFIVAVAGPLVNIVIGLLLFGYIQLAHPGLLSNLTYELYASLIADGKRVVTVQENFSKVNLMVAILVIVNLGLVLFNLIPAFPMDGGRMFRAILHNYTDKLTATKIATIVGKAISIGIFLSSLALGYYGMALIGLFIYYMASQEFKIVKSEVFRNQYIVEQMMHPSFNKINQFTTVSELKELFLNGFEKNFLFYDEGDQLKGILTKANMIEWLSSEAIYLNNHIENYVLTEFPFLEKEMKTDDALALMRSSGIYFLPIKKEGEIIGVLEMNSIYEFINIHNKIKFITN